MTNVLYTAPTEITVITGCFGSGKTELAVNYALYLRSMGESVSIIDLDVVNPYFRTSERAELFAERGIELVAPLFANTTVDVPALSPRIQGAIMQRQNRVIIDCAGEEDGATVLHRYAGCLRGRDLRVLCAVNSRRPFTENPEGVVAAVRAIEARSGVGITHLINTTNLLELTDSALVAEGRAVVKTAAERLGIAYGGSAVCRDIAAPGEYGDDVFSMQRLMRAPF